MLRWTVVLLALLFAMTEIAETATLVHVQSGAYMARHGWLPPRTDVFSYTAADRPWRNVAWLFDLIAAGAFALAGAAGLTLLKGGMTAAAFALVTLTRRTDVSSWCCTILAAAALLACQPRLNATPELVTLVGVAAVLWIWNRWDRQGRARALFALVPVVLVWSNLDPRMFLGTALILLLVLGDTLGALLHPEDRQPTESRDPPARLWLVVGACLAVSLANPFGWHALLSPLSLYGVEYPAQRSYLAAETSGHGIEFHSMISGAFWRQLTVGTMAGLLLLFAAFVLVALNHRRRRFAHLFALIGFTGFAVAAVHELAAASLVACVVAGINAQEWYQGRFRQSYSVSLSEVIFSRGGRAATVMALLALALFSMTGRLANGHRGRMGLGFTAALQAQIDDLQAEANDAFDDRPFNFRHDQGDLLIWAGQRVFVDSRVALYGGTGRDNLLALHQNLCTTFASGADEGSAALWKDVFDERDVTRVLPPLAAPFSDYATFLHLRRSRDWRLSRLGAATASFYRTDRAEADPNLRAYLQAHSINYIREAFRTETEFDGPRIEFAREPSVYERRFWRKTYPLPNAIQLAGHYQRQIDDALHTPGVQLPAPVGAALAHLALRSANQGLADVPQSAQGYRILGGMYEFLGRLEQRILGGSPLGSLSVRRYLESATAYRQSLRIDPWHRNACKNLAGLYASQRKFDLAIQLLDDYQHLGAAGGATGRAAERARLDETLDELRQQMSERVTRVEERLAQLLQSERASLLEIAAFAYDQGCVLQGIQILEDSPNFLAQSPEAQLTFALMLFEAGRCEEAQDQLDRIELSTTPFSRLRWQTPSAYAALARARYDHAMAYWNADIAAQESLRVGAVLQSLPLAGAPAPDQWPVAHVVYSNAALRQLPAELAAIWYEAALTQLEAGQNEAAAETFRTMLAVGPNTPLRPLAAFYLNLIAGDDIDPRPLSEQVPITGDMFTPEEAPKDAPPP